MKLKTTRRKKYHHSVDGETPVCGTVGEYVTIPEDELGELDLCEQCARIERDGVMMSTLIMEELEDSWMSVRDLCDVLATSERTIRRRCNELVEVGRLNRRGGMRNTDGSIGYEYSQQAVEQTNYEENTNLFESMLGDD